MLKIRVVVADYASLAHVLLGNSIITLLIFDDCSDLAALIYDTQTHSKKKTNIHILFTIFTKPDDPDWKEAGSGGCWFFSLFDLYVNYSYEFNIIRKIGEIT